MKAPILISILATLIASCGNSKNAQNKIVWLTIDPIQCLGNPWEKAWVAENSYEEYPIGHPREFETVEEMILREYFTNQDIVISKVQHKSYPEDMMVCEACSCPAGYHLYIAVDPKFKDRLVDEFGFKPMKTSPNDME